MNTKSKVLQLVIEGKPYQWDRQYITGKEIKALAGIEAEATIYLSISEPWDDELVEVDTNVDLARPGIEYFYIAQKLEFTINGVKHESPSQYISGKKVRALGKIGPNDLIYLKIQRPYKDELVEDETLVDIARPGIEEFFSVCDDIATTIVVNGTAHEWNKKKISFREVVTLAFGQFNEVPTMVYTVAYEDGPKQNIEGSMYPAQEVFAQDKMIFHATATDKS